MYKFRSLRLIEHSNLMFWIFISLYSHICFIVRLNYDCNSKGITIFWLLAVFRTGAVNSASGSAYAEFGNTKVIVSV
jgi:hypothetical protein